MRPPPQQRPGPLRGGLRGRPARQRRRRRGRGASLRSRRGGDPRRREVAPPPARMEERTRAAGTTGRRRAGAITGAAERRRDADGRYAGDREAGRPDPRRARPAPTCSRRVAPARGRRVARARRAGRAPRCSPAGERGGRRARPSRAHGTGGRCAAHVETRDVLTPRRRRSPGSRSRGRRTRDGAERSSAAPSSPPEQGVRKLGIRSARSSARRPGPERRWQPHRARTRGSPRTAERGAGARRCSAATPPKGTACAHLVLVHGASPSPELGQVSIVSRRRPYVIAVPNRLAGASDGDASATTSVRQGPSCSSATPRGAVIKNVDPDAGGSSG